MAGPQCPVEVMKRVVEEMGMAEVTICYGMTETSPVSTQTGADDDLDRRTCTVGRVHPHTEVKIVEPGDHGRRWLPQYRRQDPGNVIRGGENVYPREIEEFLYTHADIVDAQVIGVPDEQYGEELVAWMRLRPDADPLTNGQARAILALLPAAAETEHFLGFLQLGCCPDTKSTE
jgi:fatty-acyl-CoA synthase